MNETTIHPSVNLKALLQKGGKIEESNNENENIFANKFN